MQTTLDRNDRDALVVSEQVTASPDTDATTTLPTSRVDPSPLAQLWRTSAGWVLVACLLIVQWGLFYQFARREVVWAYPTNHDQNAYLWTSYETHEQILAKGLIPGLLHGLGMPL